jgi:hypothetical protein
VIESGGDLVKVGANEGAKMPTTVVKPIHFDDLGGEDFERLVYAYLLRAGWQDLAWYGQTGSDLGRDIIGVQPLEGRAARRTVVQCVNRGSLTKTKVERDMTRAAQAPSGKPDAMRFICRSKLSSNRRDHVVATARTLGIAHADAWSGEEFEEHLRRDGEFLLRRFFEGEVFPDSVEGWHRLVDDFPNLSDEEALQLMAAVFDRPVFRTPFQGESQLPAFQQAIGDTIEALNTGLWRTRQGEEIRRIPSRHHLRSASARAVLGQVVEQLDVVRAIFKAMLADGGVRHCTCGDAHCPVFMVTSQAARDLDDARSEALKLFGSLVPGFGVGLRETLS